MIPLRHFVFIALFSIGTLQTAFASFAFQDIHVLSFVPADKPDRYTIVFDAETTDYGNLTNLPRKKRRFTVRIRCEPRFCKLEDYRTAIQLLQERIQHSPHITIARMSATGWKPVRGMPGVFESVGLYVPKPPEHRQGPPVLLFLHDDRF